MVRKCLMCGREFTSAHSRTRYCSDECRRVRKSMRRQGEKRILHPSLVLTHCPKDCKYISTAGLASCDYVVIKHEPRGCDVIGCTKYERREDGCGDQDNDRWKGYPSEIG